MKKAISARIDEDTLTYIKSCHVQVNTLINTLLKRWTKDRQNKELLIWKEDTGQDELSQLKEKNDIKCSQCCNNCKYFSSYNKTEDIGMGCSKVPLYDRVNSKKFVCIYWEKKKGSH